MKSNARKLEVLIVGGGVSGASLAIRLARQGVSVTVIEKDKFPRHKLCGEFVSPECLAHFEELGVLDSMREIGGDSIQETRFFSESGKSVSVPSEWFFNGEQGALGISRSEMDFRLLEKSRESGAKVFEMRRVAEIELKANVIKRVVVSNKTNERVEIMPDLVVDATGRARALGKLIEKKRSDKIRKGKIKHIAFKAHFEKVSLEKGVCEIYFFRGGYGGLNYVEDGVANHCFLIDSKVAREFNGDPDRILKELLFKNRRAFDAMKSAEKRFDWLAVPIENFGRQPANDIENLISVGDASAFIDPFTGSGMLMALESSEILAKTIAEIPSSSILKNANQIKANYETAHAVTTRTRLNVCSVMRYLSFSPSLANIAIFSANSSRALLQRFANMTRPTQNV